MTKAEYLEQLELLYIQCGVVGGNVKRGDGMTALSKEPNIELMKAIEAEKAVAEHLHVDADFSRRAIALEAFLENPDMASQTFIAVTGTLESMKDLTINTWAARRPEWPLSQVLVAGEPVDSTISDADRSANDWEIYQMVRIA